MKISPNTVTYVCLLSAAIISFWIACSYFDFLEVLQLRKIVRSECRECEFGESIVEYYSNGTGREVYMYSTELVPLYSEREFIWAKDPQGKFVERSLEEV